MKGLIVTETLTAKRQPKKFPFTTAKLRRMSLAPSAKGDRGYVYDEKAPGLALCVRRNGAKAYYYYGWVNGGPRRVKLEDFDAGGPDEGREQLDRVRGKIRGIANNISDGLDPTADRRAAKGQLTIGELFEKFIVMPTRNRKKRERAEQTSHAYRRQYETHLSAWAKRPLSSITRSDVEALHNRIGRAKTGQTKGRERKRGGQYVANRVLALLRAMFNAAKFELGYKGENPAENIRPFEEKQRERFAYADELPRLWASLDLEPNNTVRDFFRMALFTGARRRNLESMAWSDVNLERGEWKIKKTKSGDPQTIPLSPEAQAILCDRKSEADSSWVFPGKSVRGHITEPIPAWKRICDRAKIEGLRIHDLRRTLGSWQTATGASLTVVGKSLGHHSPQATAIYARLDLAPVRAAVNTATAAIVAAANVKPKTVATVTPKKDAKKKH